MNAAVLSRWAEYDAVPYAKKYVECVHLGELTTNAHLTVFGTAVRLTVAGSVLLGIIWGLAQLL